MSRSHLKSEPGLKRFRGLFLTPRIPWVLMRALLQNWGSRKIDVK